MILDVGSGTPSRYHMPLETENTVHIDLSRKAHGVSVVCDTHFLPFRDKSFSVVYAGHILEHLDNPFLGLQEWARVSGKKVIIKVSNGDFFKWGSSSKNHIFSWTRYTFANLLRRVFSKVEIKRSDRFAIPLQSLSYTYKLIILVERFLFARHNELTAICYL